MRNFEQSMGVTLSDPMIRNPEVLKQVAVDLVNSGFEVLRPFLRLTSFNFGDPEVVQAVRVLTDAAHALGAKVVIDCEPHLKAAQEMGRMFAGVQATRLVRAKTKLVEGRYRLHFENPKTNGVKSDYLDVEAAWVRSSDGQYHAVVISDSQVDGEGEIYRNGYAFRQHFYIEGKPADRRMHTHLSGQLTDFNQGELVVYARFTERACVDFWSEGCRRYYDHILELHRDSHLDGVGWDEPAVEGDWGTYLYGDAFAQAFESKKGYSLRDKLYLLDEGGCEPEAVRVRLDYYEVLNEGVFHAQQNLIAKARALFGEDLILGSHHTWQGEGGINDYRCGAVDYFRLNDQMDAGYTDCCWWDPQSVAYAYTLGSSLGRLTPSGEAEVNTWHWKATNAMVDYNARLISLFKISWFNIFYGESSEVTRYPAHYTWDLTVQETKRNRAQLRDLKGFDPVVEVGILHGWETVCGINRPDIASAHKAFCLNQSSRFVERSIAFDWVDCRLLADATVDGEALQTGLGRYRILILPYASVLPDQAWAVLQDFAQHGGRLVFVGPPPALTSSGKSLNAAFSDMMGLPMPTLSQYLSGIDAQCQLPEFRTLQIEVSYPLRGPAERLLVSIEGEAHGARNTAGNVLYLSDLEPGSQLIDHIEAWLQPEVKCYSDAILWRLYRKADGRSKLLLAARRERQLQGIIDYAGQRIELFAGTIASIEADGNELSVNGAGVRWAVVPSDRGE
ncbi:hypothetical protein SH580_03270 [Coraliomargarita algicola]|uniref:Beta-galactosidase n=1 Tax=Coraliomargarita algicola TaxID=3092156 RepID=A0ABZ0RUT8_9BACT|nr:hypothetical protein [Coraliomargarita sp. J2-16]WPJ96724.1 hypothetical protein SH580_03270 [Coraliomargarita sp. J2-16]